MRLELPHQDLPRAETALSSCLCLGRGSCLTPVHPPYLGSCLLPWLPVTGQGHTSALVSAPSTCRQPLPLTLNVQRGQPCGCPQRCCSWARVLLGGGALPCTPSSCCFCQLFPPPGAGLPSLPVHPPCLPLLPAGGVGGCQPQSCPSGCQGRWLPGAVLASVPPAPLQLAATSAYLPPCSPLLVPPTPFPAPHSSPFHLTGVSLVCLFFFLINVFVQPQLHPWGSPQRGGQEDNLGCCGGCLCWGGE